MLRQPATEVTQLPTAVSQLLNEDIRLPQSDEVSKIVHKSKIFETIPGKSHPDRWPEGLDLLIERLQKIEFLGLFHEDFRLYRDTMDQLKSFIKSNIEAIKLKPEEQAVKSIEQGLSAMFLFALAFGDFTYWVLSF